MSENNRSDDNEIDIIEIIGILWDGKWLISSVVVIVTLIGFVYSQVRQPIYSVSVPFSVNKISPITNKKMCEIDYCLATLLNSGWSLEKKNITQLSQSTTNPLSINEYEAQLEHGNEVITNDLYFAAQSEIAMIKEELPDYLINSEEAFIYMRPANSIIRSINDGKNALAFGSISISDKSPKVQLILSLSFILGGFIGVAFTLIRFAVRNHKKNN
jgi:LPS O-antigen subunit length determinant protein (WzzB/FepE family)